MAAGCLALGELSYLPAEGGDLGIAAKEVSRSSEGKESWAVALGYQGCHTLCLRSGSEWKDPHVEGASPAALRAWGSIRGSLAPLE